MRPFLENPGKVGIVLPGGGCKYIDQVFRLYPLLHYFQAHGISIHHVTSNSAGCFTALGMLAAGTPLEGIENTIRISKEKMNAHEKIFRRHPNVQKKLDDFRYVLPHLPFHHTHKNFQEFYADCNAQVRNFFSLVGFGFRALRFIVSAARDIRNSSIFDPSFSGNNEAVIEHIAGYFFSDFKGFLDLQPLTDVLMDEIDTRLVVSNAITWHMLAKQVEDQSCVAFSPHEYAGIDPYLAKIGILNHISASCALYPIFGISEFEERGSLVHYVDYDVEDPLPIDDALEAGCDTIFVFPSVSEKHPSIPKKISSLTDLFLAFLGSYANINRSLIRSRIKNAQHQAKKAEKNIFIVPPVVHHPDLGLLATSIAAIEYHEQQENEAMKEYIENLDSHNLRYLPDIK